MTSDSLMHSRAILGLRKWHLKAIVQKSISVLPKPEKANHIFQKFITKGIELDDVHFGYKIQHASDHILYAKKYLTHRDKLEILELGTGWYPIIPIAMYLCRMGKVTSLDIQSWLTKDSILTTIAKMQEWRASGRLEDYLEYIDEKRWNALLEIESKSDSYSLEQICDLIGLRPLLIDARMTGLADDQFDFICSNNTFEHIYPDVLSGILVEFKRILKPGGLMSHFIDLSDHFAHFDTSINIYNFLRFSTKKWNLIDNSIQPQNRLRWKDYLNLYSKLHIPVSEEIIREGELSKLREVPIHAEYSSYSEADLAISHGYIVSHFT